MNWWEKESPFRYDAALISAAYGMDFWDFREKFNIPKKVLLVGDSGGFQLLTGKKEYVEPVKILKWQENNVDIGITLDSPPVDPQSFKSVSTWEEFVERTKMSVRYYSIMEKNKSSVEIEIMKVLHGSNLKELSYFYKNIKDFNFEGYALAPKPSDDPFSVALHAAFIYEMEEPKNVHILWGTGFRIVPVTVYVGRLFKRLTFDSSTYSLVGSSFRYYYCPLNPHKSSLRIRIGTKLSSNIEELPCDCPICIKYTVKDMTQPNSRSAMLISLHNLYIYLKYVEFIKKLSKSKELFTEFVRTELGEKTLKAIEFVDYALENGIEEAYAKYEGYFAGKGCESATSKQMCLW